MKKAVSAIFSFVLVLSVIQGIDTRAAAEFGSSVRAVHEQEHSVCDNPLSALDAGNGP